MTNQKQKKVCVGDLFCRPGIDTKCFYEVVGITASGKTVRVQKVVKEILGDIHDNIYYVKPLKGKYTDDDEPWSKRLSFPHEPGCTCKGHGYVCNTTQYSIKIGLGWYGEAFLEDWEGKWRETGSGTNYYKKKEEEAKKKEQQETKKKTEEKEAVCVFCGGKDDIGYSGCSNYDHLIICEHCDVNGDSYTGWDKCCNYGHKYELIKK